MIVNGSGTIVTRRHADLDPDVAGTSHLSEKAADDAFDECPIRIHLGRLVEEGLEVGLLFDLGFEPFLGVAGQPADDLVDLSLRAALVLGLGHVVGIHGRKGSGIDPMLGRRHSANGNPSDR